MGGEPEGGGGAEVAPARFVGGVDDDLSGIMSNDSMIRSRRNDVDTYNASAEMHIVLVRDRQWAVGSRQWRWRWRWRWVTTTDD